MNKKKNTYKEFEWVRRVIASCKTYEQLGLPITRLIGLFYKKHRSSQLYIFLQEEQTKQYSNIKR